MKKQTDFNSMEVEEIKNMILGIKQDGCSIKMIGGRAQGRTYKLISALIMCVEELQKQNDTLKSNIESQRQTNDVLLKRILDASIILDKGHL